MMLFLGAQDLKEISIGLIESKRLISLQVIVSRPEAYLKEIDRFLRTQQITPSALEGIVVVTGPGSFTSSRIIVTIANALHFSHGLALVGIENPDKLSPSELIANMDWHALISKDYVHASYGRPAHITKPRENN